MPPPHIAEKATIYLHIPFCRTKCSYCSFNSHAGRENEIPSYFLALEQQIKEFAAHTWTRSRLFTSLYIGGGTPTICDSKHLTGIINKCREFFHISDDAEITVESNPNTLSDEKIHALLQAGVNRLSIGVQSFSGSILRSLARSHSADQAHQAFSMARRAGFANISLDLMYGLPDQSLADWQMTLETALSLAPDHLSLYELMVEEGTPFAEKQARGNLHLPGDDDVAEMEILTSELLEKKNLIHYEISNFARQGFNCLHNINYWENRSWLGIGAGATGSLSGVRLTNASDPADYTRLLQSGKSPFIHFECLCREARFRETVIMGLRMLDGICLEELEKRFHLNPQQYYGSILDEFIAQNMVEISKGYLRLTKKSLPVANQVLCRLV